MLGAILGHISDVARANIRAGICEVPVVCLLPICAAEVSVIPPTPPTTRTDFPGLMAIQHRALDELSIAGHGAAIDLALNMKHAELAVRDLVVMVQSSDLTSRDVLADTLTTFILEAREAGRGLQSLSSKIDGTLDSIGAFNTYMLRAVESAKAATKTENPGDLALDLFVLRTFQSSFAWFASAISDIILEAVPLTSQLELLEERLATVHAIALQEDLINSIVLDDLLWTLWTRLGGNRQQRRDLENRASLLQNVQIFRSVAVAYVASTMRTLTTIDAELGELRDRLSAPSVERNAIPLEVQLEAIQRSALRIQQGGYGREVIHLSWMREEVLAVVGKT
ncbi:hypothetical protein K466DRAFT_502840 [Polyporus arcularius HHB13444]|uniref:Uncharacterized protein n=1 Tax=Polyporus arcularius HHB13444 TaxID=1314778 RepID=A0A5C3NUP0_9APHY|nr:hypothetical protein K466DRAFT_502840 [Polyporus arcularius HHB13444]